MSIITLVTKITEPKPNRPPNPEGAIACYAGALYALEDMILARRRYCVSQIMPGVKYRNKIEHRIDTPLTATIRFERRNYDLAVFATDLVFPNP